MLTSSQPFLTPTARGPTVLRPIRRRRRSPVCKDRPQQVAFVTKSWLRSMPRRFIVQSLERSSNIDYLTVSCCGKLQFVGSVMF
ncbi:hypothetical protein DY000_02014793 [Brassica cretica]|uniref:Uncharacterized protein n=1 Tax=Brassica cretica TaxID=69181 RepID=A0ABQ7D5U0_BRACR|nr:hypothetical protein DY000_02014793 [Brassica cretica]